MNQPAHQMRPERRDAYDLERNNRMFADYLAAAMRHAKYELIEDGTYFGAIDELPGSWANAATLEKCKQEMEEVAEDWILLAIARHQDLPVIDGHTIMVAKVGE
jgi:predicted RNase H-like HicB family nuclease